MEETSELNQAFAHAADNSDTFDFGFVDERAEKCNLANFDFPPDEAAAMRERELARIAAELESEEAVYDDDEDDDFLLDRDEFDDDEDDTDFDLDDEDEDDYDRFSDSVGGDDDWDDDLEDEEDYDDDE